MNLKFSSFFFALKYVIKDHNIPHKHLWHKFKSSVENNSSGTNKHLVIENLNKNMPRAMRNFKFIFLTSPSCFPTPLIASWNKKKNNLHKNWATSHFTTWIIESHYYVKWFCWFVNHYIIDVDKEKLLGLKWVFEESSVHKADSWCILLFLSMLNTWINALDFSSAFLLLQSFVEKTWNNGSLFLSMYVRWAHRHVLEQSEFFHWNSIDGVMMFTMEQFVIFLKIFIF